MAWVSKSLDGQYIKAESKGASVTVETIGGNAVLWSNCKPGDNIFAKLVKEARYHCSG